MCLWAARVSPRLLSWSEEHPIALSVSFLGVSLEGRTLIRRDPLRMAIPSPVFAVSVNTGLNATAVPWPWLRQVDRSDISIQSPIAGRVVKCHPARQ